MVCKQGWGDESNEKMEILTKDSQAVKLIVSEKTVADVEEIWKNKHFCSILAWGVSKPSRMSIQSVQFSHSVVSDFLQPHGLQHARLPFPSPTPGAYWNSCLLSWWCHPTISSSVVLFSSCPQSFLASGSFPMSHFFTSGGQGIGVSASASVRPMNTQEDLLKEGMATYSSIPAWRIPGTEESGWLTSMGSHRVRHEWSKLTVAAVVLCIRWPKYWNFSFSISSSNEHPGLISFRMDWLDLLAVQGTLKSLLQHHS